MKQIPLTQNKFAIVDDEDYDFLMQWKWRFQKNHKRDGGYAIRSVFFYNEKREEDSRTVLMHRLINKTPDDFHTDHINGDGLDNRRENLRTATGSQNKINTKKRPNLTSQYKGVSFVKAESMWRAGIVANYKFHWLGQFKTEKEAALIYNAAAIKYHGEFAILNEVQ